jgi:hypothetical protein
MPMTQDQRTEAVTSAWQSAPSLAAIMTWLAGLTVEKWLGVVGIAFIGLQAVGYLWRLRRDMRREAERVRLQSMQDTDRGELT